MYAQARILPALQRLANSNEQGLDRPFEFPALLARISGGGFAGARSSESSKKVTRGVPDVYTPGDAFCEASLYALLMHLFLPAPLLHRGDVHFPI